MLLLKSLILLITIYELSAQQYKIVCYITNWAQYRPEGGKWFPSQTDPNLCTHIMYSFAKLTNGQLDRYEWNDDVLYKQTTDLKKVNSNLKVLIAVGGWNMGSTDFSNMVSTDAGIDRFVNTTIDYLRTWNFDGLDLDWEYPAFGSGSRPSDKQRFTILCQRLKAAFRQYGYLLTAAVSAGKNTIDNAYEISEIAKHLDFLNVMTYDFHGGWDRKLGANAPLQAHPTQNEQTFSLEYAIRYYIAGGFPAANIMLGMGTYGRSMTLANSNNHAMGSAATGPGASGTWTRESGFLSYYEICRNNWPKVWDDPTKTPYAHSGLQWVSFDDYTSLGHKVNFLKSLGLGGAMFWALDLDDFRGEFCNNGSYPLVRQVRYHLDGTTPPTVGPTTPAPTGSTTSSQTGATTSNPGPTQCPQPNGNFPYPHNCEQFLMCANGVANLANCPGGLHFNPTSQNCDWPSSAGCTSGK